MSARWGTGGFDMDARNGVHHISECGLRDEMAFIVIQMSIPLSDEGPLKSP